MLQNKYQSGCIRLSTSTFDVFHPSPLKLMSPTAMIRPKKQIPFFNDYPYTNQYHIKDSPISTSWEHGHR